MSVGAEEVYTEILAQRLPKPRVDILDRSFKHQTEFIEDPARLKALFCTRRSAKSYTGGLALVQCAEDNPGVNCLFIGLTRLSAKGIIWKDVLKDINKRFNLGLSFNGSELTATTANGSIIYVTGVDADEEEKQKLLGKKYKLVVCDEAASYSIDLRELIYGILKPATIDQGGTVCLMGTSGNITKGLFYDITTGREPGWKVFQWTAHDNPYVAAQWQEELDDIKANRPLFMETPLFKQWYLNEWVVDDEKRVYRFAYGKNEFDLLPTYRTGSWRYVLGVDLGYSPDPSAFVITAFHDHDPHLYMVEMMKRTEMDVTDVANTIKEYQRKYPQLFRVVIDGSNKQAVQEIQNRHGIALTAADKTGKVDFIQIMNSELIQGKVKLHQLHGKELIEEYQGLIWQTIGDKIVVPRKEHPNCANHLCDAALYAWRFCYTYMATLEKPAVNLKDKNQYLSHTQKLMEDALERQIQQQKWQEHEKDQWNLSAMDSDAQRFSYFINKRKNS